MRCGLVLALLCLAATAPAAAGKGLELSMRAVPGAPATGEQVTIELRGEADEEFRGPCRRMRMVVVAPGVSVRRALRALEGGAEPRPIGRWGAFRLASLRSVGELRWTGRLRPNRPGRWMLVVPNWCAAGYALPDGAERLRLDVRAAARR
jgi:hypothetical protein